MARPTLHVMLMAVRLDWRLLVAAARSEPDGAILPALIGALVLWSLCQSAMANALLVQANPGLGATALSTYAWLTALAATGLGLVVGQPSVAERLTVHLRFAPVSRPEMFAALQALTIAGRYLGVAGLVSIPLGLLVVTLLPLRRAALVVGLWMGVLWTLPTLVRVVRATVRRLSYTVLFALVAGTVALGTLTTFVGVVPILVAALPPNVMVRIAIAGPTTASWLLLFGWVTLLWLAEFHVLSWRELRASVRAGSSSVTPVVPGWMRTVSRVCRVPPILLHGEFLRLMRWRRFILGWMVGLAIIAMLVSRLDLTADRLLYPVILLAVPTWIMSGVLANIFATDRAGIQAYFLCIADLRSVLRAKICAVAAFVAVAQVVIVGIGLYQDGQRDVAYLYAPVTAAGGFVWIAHLGLVTSVLFPRPSEPDRTGGGAVSAPAATVMLLGNGLLVGLIIAGAILYDAGRIAGLGLMAFAAVTSGLAAVAASVLPRVAHRLLCTRRERLTMELALDTVVV